MGMKRRRFLKNSFFVLASIPALGTAAYWMNRTTPYELFSDILNDKLHYLLFSDDIIRQYTDDTIDFHFSQLPHKNLAMNMAATALEIVSSFGKYEDDLESFKEKVARDFLLSTDFFQTGADEDRPLQYMGYYHPLARPCQNPFFKFT